jgi:HPt (histidine-containing phosphotransfer) domain-containing protein
MAKKLISLRQIENITNSDPAAMKELLAIFTKEAARQIQRMENSFGTKNWDELKSVSHKMKSSLALIGLDAHRRLAETVELTAGNDPKKTKNQVNELLEAYRQALTELQATAKDL